MDSIRAAPVRDPLHAFDLFQRLLAQALLIHADEPLRGRTEDDWRLVTPAARIAVLHFSTCSSAPLVRSMSTIMSFALKTLMPSSAG